MIIRRNAAPKRARAPSDDQEERERKALTERMDEMGGSHVAAGVGAGAIGNVLGVIAVAMAMVNVVGGFMVTDRMLQMFKKR